MRLLLIVGLFALLAVFCHAQQQPEKPATAWPDHIFVSGPLGQEAQIKGNVYSVNGELLAKALSDKVKERKDADAAAAAGAAGGAGGK